MEIPFADSVSGRRGRREAALELIEAVEDENVDSVSAVELPAAEPALLLQKMENKLVRHHLATPDVLSGEELRKLRYVLNFARLADFEPGRRGPGRQSRTRGRLGGRRDRAVAGQGRRRAVRTVARRA